MGCANKVFNCRIALNKIVFNLSALNTVLRCAKRVQNDRLKSQPKLRFNLAQIEDEFSPNEISFRAEFFYGEK